MRLRIAIMGIYHESNTFIKKPTELAEFLNGHWLKGNDIVEEYQNAFHEIGGMLGVLQREDIQAIPVMFAEATPGGVISAATYNILLHEMMAELEKVFPVDGCLVVPHGAAVSKNFPDMDGHWLSILRKKVGNRIPIIGTLDPHANVSQLMVNSTNSLIAYKTNPHIDQRQTGMEAAELMVKVLKHQLKPFHLLVRLPFIISIEQQHTESEPCKSLYAYANVLSRQLNIISVSILLGFPYADVEEMGTSVIVISTKRPQHGLGVGLQLKSYILNNQRDFVGKKNNISDLYSAIKESGKPVLLLDMGDNVGGGAPGNSTFLLEKLEQWNKCRFFICIYAPDLVEYISQHEIESTFNIYIGNKENFDDINLYTVTLLDLREGKFKETSPRHGGNIRFNMGLTAVLKTEKGNMIMLTSRRVLPFSLQQLLSFNIKPEDFDVIVAKGVNAPIAAYKTICQAIFKVNTPGVTCADLKAFQYNNRRRPMFPFEEIEDV